jgi:two-component system NtrC family sensor kinase
VIDDNEAIHQDFRKILCEKKGHAELDAARAELLDDPPPDTGIEIPRFEVDSALQGAEGLDKMRQALKENRPYALTFVDVRMPPGWDGVETLERIWKEDSSIQAVICSAHSDYTWPQMIAKLKVNDGLLILKKPFDHIEVRQLACALTEKWNLAKESRSRLANLETAVAQGTREFEEQRNHLHDSLAKLQQAHTQLLQSEKMASIGQLAAGVAHEINNPIGFISSNLNSLADYSVMLGKALTALRTLLQDCLTDGSPAADRVQSVRQLCEECDVDYITADLHKLVEESMEGTRRVRQIVADLRDFSHMDSPDVAEEDVNKLLDKTINVAWNELKYKAEVTKEYGAIPAIRCYGGKLGQVFVNLLVNAAQAIKERGRITVRTGLAGDHVWVEIEDTGCGIPPEAAGRVFEPFYTTKEVGKGTGMGLHIAYKIIEAHGGKISLRSKVGEGTVFRVELPVAGPSGTPDQETQHEPTAPGP